MAAFDKTQTWTIDQASSARRLTRWGHEHNMMKYFEHESWQIIMATAGVRVSLSAFFRKFELYLTQGFSWYWVNLEQMYTNTVNEISRIAVWSSNCMYQKDIFVRNSLTTSRRIDYSWSGLARRLDAICFLTITTKEVVYWLTQVCHLELLYVFTNQYW